MVGWSGWEGKKVKQAKKQVGGGWGEGKRETEIDRKRTYYIPTNNGLAQAVLGKGSDCRLRVVEYFSAPFTLRLPPLITFAAN